MPAGRAQRQVGGKAGRWQVEAWVHAGLVGGGLAGQAGRRAGGPQRSAAAAGQGCAPGSPIATLACPAPGTSTRKILPATPAWFGSGGAGSGGGVGCPGGGAQPPKAASTSRCICAHTGAGRRWEGGCAVQPHSSASKPGSSKRCPAARLLRPNAGPVLESARARASSSVSQVGSAARRPGPTCRGSKSPTMPSTAASGRCQVARKVLMSSTLMLAICGGWVAREQAGHAGVGCGWNW